jgi:hypothetical protein
MRENHAAYSDELEERKTMKFHAMLRAAEKPCILYPEANGGDTPTNRAQQTISSLRSYAIYGAGTLGCVLAAARVKRRRAKAWSTRVLREKLPRHRRLTGPRKADIRRQSGGSFTLTIAKCQTHPTLPRECQKADSCHGWSCTFCAACGTVTPCARPDCESCGEHPEMLEEATRRRAMAGK